jgi:hypothetical protein
MLATHAAWSTVVPTSPNGFPNGFSGTAQGPPNEEGGPNNCMVIPDCGGRCEFEFETDTLSLESTLRGQVTFSHLTKTIVSAHVVVLRAELVGGNVFEVRKTEHILDFFFVIAVCF